MSMSAIFRLPVVVQPEDIDVMKHVNNEVYLSWLVRAATAHSASLGYDIKKYFEDGAAFVVRRHEVDYLRSAVFGDSITVETWIEDYQGARTNREYRIIRDHDQKVLVEAKTMWVYINIQTGRPMQIPEALVKAFSNKE